MADGDLVFQFRMLRRKLLQRPAENAAKPGIDIAERRLSRFQTNKIRHDAAVYLAANAFHRAVADALLVGNQNVAGRCADHFHQRIRLRARANRAHMAVKRAARDDHAFRQAEALRPLRAQRANRQIGSEGIGKQRQTAPALMPQRFMSGATATTANILRARGAGEQGRHPVAQLNPGGGSLRDGAVLTRNVQNFRPEPFAGVNAADVAGIIGFARRMAQAGDGFRFFDRGVIFPQDEHRIRVFGELRTQRQYVAVGINGGGGGAGAVDADADHLATL